MADIYTNLNDGCYDNTMRYPKRDNYSTTEEFKAARKVYAIETDRLFNEFKIDAIEEAGLTGHPKAEKAFDMAKEYGRSSGYHAILSYLLDIAEVLL